MTRRGFTVLEVEEAIRTVTWQPAELERLECRKTFAYGKEWNGRVYAAKQVRPIFVEGSFRNCCGDGLHILF